MNNDLFINAVLPQGGKYGIENSQKIIEASNGVFDLANAIYFDDKKFGNDDLIDLVSLGPAVIQKILEAGKGITMVDDELLDLDENEKAVLVAQTGGRLNNSGYQKIVKGVFEILDGIAELANPENPRD